MPFRGVCSKRRFYKKDFFLREDFFETNLDLSKHPEQVFCIFLPHVSFNFQFLFFPEEKLRKKWGKNPKTCWGCLRKSRLVSKKSSRKKNFFCKKHFLRKHPQVAKKLVFSLKNRNFCYFFQVL